MKIQQHDGVVVDAAGSRQGFAKRKRGGEVLRREREAPRARVWLPSLPTLYIGALGGVPALGDASNERGGVHLHTLVDRERKRSRERG